MVETLQATFEPSPARLLTETPQASLLTESPILALALSNVFPYLLLVDYVLEFITWTNEDPYQNFLLITAYLFVVMYWNIVSVLALPLLFALSFSMVVFSINLIIMDSKFNEKPTIDEVLHTVHNLTVRLELIYRPVKHLTLTRKNVLVMVGTCLLLTPIHMLLVSRLIGTRRYLWLAGIFVLAYHLPWFFAIRRLLWRLLYVRIAAFYITGLDIKLDRRNQNHHHSISRIHSPATSEVEDNYDSEYLVAKVQLLSDFRILKKTITSPTQLKQIVLFDILENERRWFGIGWAKFLLPTERALYCYKQSLMGSPQVPENDSIPKEATTFPFPEFEHDLHLYLWQWVDDNWKIDKEFNLGKNPEGWVYYDNNWENPTYEDSISKYTRSRNWTRKASLVIDKKDEVQDI